MHVRRAQRSDLPKLTVMAAEAARARLGDIVAPDGEVAAPSDMARPSLVRRLLAGKLLVCCIGEDLVGAIDYEAGQDHVRVRILRETRQVAKAVDAMMNELHVQHPNLPISSDVVLGHLESEHLHETIGFVPGEVVGMELAGREVVGRRWWLLPRAHAETA